MNPFIRAQLVNLKSMALLGQQNCHTAAKEDDGRISKAEEKQLKAIDRAVERFVRDIDRIK